jgi:serine/threonine-protein kinase RsbW
MRPSMETRPGVEALPTAEAAVVRLTIPAKAEYVVLCRLALVGLARARPLSDEELADLKLALTEACSNSVRHAYPGDEEGHIQISYTLDRDGIAIEVVDDGAGFDPVAQRTLDEDRGEGGLGIAIIRALVDELVVESKRGSRGSRLRFVKRLGG